MTRTSIITTFAFVGLITGCLADPRPSADYCGNDDGDAFCERMAAQTPYCVLSTQSCYDAAGITVEDTYGCVAVEPAAECRAACGIGNDESCDPTDPTVAVTSETETSSSTGGDTETDPSTDTETGDTSSSTTGPECMDDVECMEPSAPFCEAGACVGCSVAGEDANMRCAELDEATPFCAEDTCVQCAVDDGSQCGGTTPLCDVANNSCIACTFHEECQEIGSPACDFTDGSCFDPASATMVNLAGAGALQTAIDEVEDGEHRALVVTGSLANQSATVDGGKVIAIVSPNNSVQNIQGAGANTILTVSGPGSTALLHRVSLQGSSAVGVNVTASGTLYADSTQVADNGDGGITLGTGTTARLRNCMVGGDQNDVVAVDAGTGTLEVVYSAFLSGFGNSAGLTCGAGGSVTVRNSIITTRGGMPASSCAGAMLTDTAVEDTGNTAWFEDYSGGDAHLTPAGQTEFMNVATWREGDPRVDFDGDERPNEEGASDYPGADVP